MKESKARSVTPRPDPTSRKASSGKREDGQTAEGGNRGGGRMFGAREAAIRSKPPPSVRASSPDARRPPPGGRRKRSPAPAGRAQAARPPEAERPEVVPSTLRGREFASGQAPPHLAKPGVQPGAESGSGGLGVPVGFLSNRHDKPGATGDNACTREQRSGGPSSARSGGTTDHAAERNAGSGQAGSVTERSDGASPCGTRTAWSGAGPG